MGDAGNWCLIESDPGVFTELINGFGVKGLECEEVYDLNNLENVSDALGFIFLFKLEDHKEIDGKIVTDDRNNTIFFAKQVIKNACATQALLNVLMNVSNKDFTLGDTLTEFKSFVDDFDSAMKGTALSNSDSIRIVHNSFSSQHIFEFDEKFSKKDDDVYHFIGYVPIENIIYELDGLKSAPVEHCSCQGGKNWINAVKPILEKRMGKCSDGNFNLMAIVPQRLAKYEKELAELKVKSSSPNAELVNEFQKNIEIEKKKILSQKAENIRRRHNYLPFILELLKVMADNGKLVELVENAEKLAKERQAVKVAAKQSKAIKF